MRFIFTFLGKSVLAALRLSGRKGSALPGLIVDKLYPGYLAKMLGRLPQGVVVVVGTNGKTTTTKVISELLESQGLRVLSNPTGSNFVRGIVATIVDLATWDGKLPYDIAIIEQDEAWAVHFVQKVRPRGVVVLNVMRDQMDRFGEIDATAQLLGKAVASVQEWVVLNANDPRVAQLASATDKKVAWFGHTAELLDQYIGDDQHHSSDQLQFFEAAPPLARLTELGPQKIAFTINNAPHSLITQLDGSHNAINMMAAITTVMTVMPKVDLVELLSQAANITPAFGRGERIVLPGGGELRLQLVKNPSGFTHSLRLLSQDHYDIIGLAINDNYSDGRDVSWLWDVDYQPLAAQSAQLLCGGSRAHDMAVRLKYDDLPVANSLVDPQEFLAAMSGNLASGHKAIIFCTYTAMLSLRKRLKKQHKNLVTGGL